MKNPWVILTSLIAMGGILWRIASWKASIDQNIATMKENADEDRSVIRSFMEEIRDDIKEIFKSLGPATVEGGSPLRLTDFGKEIATHIGARTWASELAPQFVDEVRDKKPFEVDRFCEEYVTRRLTEEWKNKVAECAYEFGTRQDNVLPVLRVVLRDELFRRLSNAD